MIAEKVLGDNLITEENLTGVLGRYCMVHWWDFFQFLWEKNLGGYFAKSAVY